MTKKRFIVKGFDEYDKRVWDTEFEESCDVEQVVRMLNNKNWVIDELRKENEQLENKYHTIQELYEEDNYHTIQELYEFRLMYNALLFNEWSNREDIEVYKSKRHDDGSIPFDDENWFIVVAILPNGKQITNHYHIDYWDYFQIKEYPKVKDKFDGHTSEDVLDRLRELI